MDKTKSSKAAVKVITHEKQVLQYSHHHSTDKDKQFFKVEENDFPSLSEVREKRKSAAEKNSSTCEVSSLTYSSKLKTLPLDSPSQHMKFESGQHCVRASKNESPMNRAGSGRHLGKPSQAEQSNHQRFTKQLSAVSNAVPSSNKKSTDSRLSSSFTEAKSKKSDHFNECKNVKTPYGQNSVNDNRSPRTIHGESSTSVKVGHSPNKGQNPSNSSSANVQKPPISKSLLSPRKSNAESSAIRSERFYNKESDGPNMSTQHKRHFEANRRVSSRAVSGQGARLLQVNAVHGNVSGNDSNKPRVVSNLVSQRAYNSVKPESNAGNPQSSLAAPSETKKKKKRKSKLKRQAALQTGKISFLTPEVHSKIVSQSSNACVQKHQKVLTNIKDNEEYPELGAAEPKSVKESHVTSVHTKEENPTNLIAFGSETNRKENLLVFKDSSANDNEAEAESNEKNNVPVEKTEVEKSTVHSNNPITLSLFDMLLSAKPRRKEPEKKDESIDEAAKVFKKEMIKRNVPQAVNPLASSKLTIKRGKEREKPKVKKPSRMRRLILMERQLRRENIEMKKHETEDANQEKCEEILSGINMFDDTTEFSAQHNLETCDKILQNYISIPDLLSPEFHFPKNDSETFKLNDDLSDETSPQLAIEDSNRQSAPKNCILIEKMNKILNDANHSIENNLTYIVNLRESKKELNSESSILDIENDFISNPDSSLTDKEDFVEDINTVDNVTEISSSTIRNLCESIKNSNCSTNYRNKNLKGEAENDYQTYNFSNRMPESEHKPTGMTENVMPAIVNSNINTNIEFNSGESDSSEAKKSNGYLDSTEKIVSNISANSFSDQEKIKATKFMLHSRKFRQYCDHFISKEIDQAVFSLIDDLARFQDRMYQKDPVKAKIRRRLVYGLKEIKKHMKLKKIKCIIIATDIEDIKIEGGLNDSLRELISLAETYHVPCVFSHRRFNLGKVCRKSVPVSCVGIFNYEGSEKNFKKMVELHEDSKHDYLEVTQTLASELTDDQVKELFEAEKESILFLREVSQRILREKVYFTPEGYRNHEISDCLEKSTNVKSENSVLEPCQQLEDSDLLPSYEKPLSLIECSEELGKSDKDKNLLLLNETDMNTILVKYKVVKEC